MDNLVNDRFSHFLSGVENKLNVYTAKLEMESFQDFFDEIKNNKYNFRLIDICAVDNKDRVENTEYRFSCYYHLLNFEDFNRYFIEVNINLGDKLISIKNQFPNALHLENEIFDLFGIYFTEEEGANIRIYTRGNIVGHPLLKDFVPCNSLGEVVLSHNKDKELVNLKFLHPVQVDSPKIKFLVNDGYIDKTFIETGFRHLGVEKLFESKNYNDNISIAGRLSSNGSTFHTLTYVKTIEEFLEIKIPLKAQAIRMILSELARISDHFTCIGVWAFEFEANHIHFECLKAREHILKLFSLYDENRVNHRLFCFGGISKEMPKNWHLDCLDTIKVLRSILIGVQATLTNSKVWHDRNQFGILNSHDAIAYGHSGPNLRASGMNYDIRKRFPYYFYGQIDFQVPLSSDGKSFDRYIVRAEEIKQSIAMIMQLIDGIPSGDFRNDNHCLNILTDLKEGEDLKNHLELQRRPNYIRKGSFYSSVESSNGELGVHMFSDGLDKPYRLHFIGPNLGHLETFKSMTSNLAFENAAAVFRSLNINSNEIER